MDRLSATLAAFAVSAGLGAILFTAAPPNIPPAIRTPSDISKLKPPDATNEGAGDAKIATEVERLRLYWEKEASRAANKLAEYRRTSPALAAAVRPLAEREDFAMSQEFFAELGRAAASAKASDQDAGQCALAFWTLEQARQFKAHPDKARAQAVAGLATRRNVARNVRRLRAERGLSLAELAAKSGLSVDEVEAIEQGNARGDHGKGTLVLANALGTTLNVLCQASTAGTGIEIEPPPAIGSGKVTRYVDRVPESGLGSLIRWATAEAEKIKCRSPLLYECERQVALADLPPTSQAAADEARRIARAAGVTVDEVMDGACVIAVSQLANNRPAGGISQASRQDVAGANAGGNYQAALSPVVSPWAATTKARRQRLYEIKQQKWQIGQAQAIAAANAQQAQSAAPYDRGALSSYGYPAPYAYPLPLSPGPFYETVSIYGNQTYINGIGPAGPFTESISRYGPQTNISGVGPYGLFNETISQYGNQTNISGYGVSPMGAYGYGFQPYAGGYGYGGGFAPYGGFGAGY